jgi:excisionase family DNA binding protein
VNARVVTTVGTGLVPTAAPQRLLVTVPEAAAILGMGQVSVWGLVSSGQLPSVKLGRSRRIRTADLTKFVDDLAEVS